MIVHNGDEEQLRTAVQSSIRSTCCGPVALSCVDEARESCPDLFWYRLGLPLGLPVYYANEVVKRSVTHLFIKVRDRIQERELGPYGRTCPVKRRSKLLLRNGRWANN